MARFEVAHKFTAKWEGGSSPGRMSKLGEMTYGKI